MERQHDADMDWPKVKSNALGEAGRVSGNWDKWYNDRINWAVQPANCNKTKKAFCFQDDSCI